MGVAVFHVADLVTDFLLCASFWADGWVAPFWLTLFFILVANPSMLTLFEFYWIKRKNWPHALANFTQTRMFVEAHNWLRMWRNPATRAKADFRGGIRIFESLNEAMPSAVIQLSVLFVSQTVSPLRVAALSTSLLAGAHTMVTASETAGDNRQVTAVNVVKLFAQVPVRLVLVAMVAAVTGVYFAVVAAALVVTSCAGCALMLWHVRNSDPACAKFLDRSRCILSMWQWGPCTLLLPMPASFPMMKQPPRAIFNATTVTISC
jgi:hypothetical protein